MKLEVGMYVRTNEGIGTVQRIYNNKNDCTVKFKKGHVKKWVTIFKASHNIIDLIEVGDVITFKNDKDVYRVTCIPNKKYACNCFYLEFNHLELGVEDIFVSKTEMKKNLYSIVTKEQFESMQYKIGE